jgi:hypothetical protein
MEGMTANVNHNIAQHHGKGNCAPPPAPSPSGTMGWKMCVRKSNKNERDGSKQRVVEKETRLALELAVEARTHINYLVVGIVAG